MDNTNRCRRWRPEDEVTSKGAKNLHRAPYIGPALKSVDPSDTWKLDPKINPGMDVEESLPDILVHLKFSHDASQRSNTFEVCHHLTQLLSSNQSKASTAMTSSPGLSHTV